MLPDVKEKVGGEEAVEVAGAAHPPGNLAESRGREQAGLSSLEWAVLCRVFTRRRFVSY